MRKIAIIGAGPSGLCSARHLTVLSNIFQVKVFEKCHRVGGTWVYSSVERSEDVAADPSQSTVHSSMYRNLRLVRIYFINALIVFHIVLMAIATSANIFLCA